METPDWFANLWPSLVRNVHQILNYLRCLAPWTKSPTEIYEIRIVLIGKPGSEKNATGNAILGKEAFAVDPGTRSCQLGIKEWEKRRLVLINTPDDFSIGSDRAKDSPESQQCLCLSRPGPHALLLVTQLGCCNEVDQEVVAWLQEVFGREAMWYTILVFTGGGIDSRTLEEHLSRAENKGLRSIIAQHHLRYCPLDNHKQDESQGQAQELLSKVKAVLQNNRETPSCNPQSSQDPTEKDPPLPVLEVERPQEAVESTGVEQGGEDLFVHVTLKEAADPVPAEQESASWSPLGEPELRIVLVGKSGVGKSAAGNTLLGKKTFDSTLQMKPVTKSCQLGIREWKGKRIVVIDTPGSLEPAEIRRCLRLSSPHPHAVVLVVEVQRFTEEDHQAVQQVWKIFGRQIQKSMMVVFSHKERLESRSLEDYLSHVDNRYFQELSNLSREQFSSINNKETEEELAVQAEELLSRIEKMALGNLGESPSVKASDKDAEEQCEERGGSNQGETSEELAAQAEKLLSKAKKMAQEDQGDASSVKASDEDAEEQGEERGGSNQGETGEELVAQAEELFSKAKKVAQENQGDASSMKASDKDAEEQCEERGGSNQGETGEKLVAQAEEMAQENLGDSFSMITSDEVAEAKAAEKGSVSGHSNP